MAGVEQDEGGKMERDRRVEAREKMFERETGAIGKCLLIEG